MSTKHLFVWLLICAATWPFFLGLGKWRGGTGGLIIEGPSRVATLPEDLGSWEKESDFQGIATSAKARLEASLMNRATVLERLSLLRHSGDPRLAFDERLLLWRRLAELDSAEAANQAISLPFGSERTAAIREIMSYWAIHDPAAALAWAQGIEDPIFGGGLRRIIRESRFVQMIEQGNTFAAVETLREIPDGDEKISAMRALSNLLIHYDQESLVSVIAEVPSTNGKMMEIGMFFRTWGEFDPFAAADWALGVRGQLPTGSALSNHMSHWSMRDPDAALAWVSATPPSRTTDIAKHNVIVASVRAGAELGPRLEVLLEIQDERQRGGTFGTLVSMAGREGAYQLLEQLPEGAFKEQMRENIAKLERGEMGDSPSWRW